MSESKNYKLGVLEIIPQLQEHINTKALTTSSVKQGNRKPNTATRLKVIPWGNTEQHQKIENTLLPGSKIASKSMSYCCQR